MYLDGSMAVPVRLHSELHLLKRAYDLDFITLFTTGALRSVNFLQKVSLKCGDFFGEVIEDSNELI